jgi:5,10-methylenetetrahydrofolate reductase
VLFRSGNSLEQRTSFLIACAANPLADNMDREIARLSQKIEAGADVIFTQPIYEMRTLEQLVKRVEQWHVPIILGILPLRSYRHAEFLHNEIPGMAIPESIRESLRSAGNKASLLGVQLTKEFLRNAKHLVSGAYIMPPFRKYEVIPEILEALQ